MPGLFDRIKDTTQYSGLLSVGTSFVVDNTPSPVYQSFRSRYAINDANISVAVVGQATNNWMVCWCTYTALDTLRVDQIIFTSNTVTPDAAVTFSGTSDVFVTASSRAVAALREANTFTANNRFSANVGLGVDASSSRFTVKATASNINATTWTAQDDGSLASIFADSADNAWLRLWDGAGTEQFRLRSGGDTFLNATGGNVGIGTSVPLGNLTISSSSGNENSHIRVETVVRPSLSLIQTSVQAWSFWVDSGDSSKLKIGVANGGISSGTPYITSTTGGNIGIGSTAPKTRLQATAATALNSPVLGSATNAPFYVTNNDIAYGLLVGTSTTGDAWLQAQRTDGTATPYNIILNPAGGRVGIGTASPGSTLELRTPSGAADLRLTSGSTLYANIYASATDFSLIAVQSTPLVLGTANTQRMTIDTLGNVGIGTPSPSSYDAKLAVFNGNFALSTTTNKLYLYYFTGTNHAHISTDTGGQITISNGTGGVVERVRINTDGRVGMGRAPDHSLDVQSSSGSTVIRGLSANSPTTILSEVRQDTGYNPAFLTMRRINIAGSATPSAVSIGEIRWDGSTTASVYNSFAFIRCDISTNSVNGAASAIVLGTATGAAANDAADKFWLHSSGGVSIGNSNNPGTGTVRIGRNNTASEGGQIEFCRANDNTVGWYIDSYGSAAGASPTELRFIDFAGGGINRLSLTARGILTIGVDAGPTDTDTFAVGFRGAPNNVQNAAYTFALTDAGKTVYHDEATARTWTIPANSAVAFPIGTCIIIDNTGNAGAAGTITLQITTDTLRRGDGTAGVGQRSIAASRVAMIRKTKTTEWVITGTFG